MIVMLISPQFGYADYYLPDESGKVEYMGPGNQVKVIHAVTKKETIVAGERQPNNRIYLPSITKYFPEIKKSLDQHLGTQVPLLTSNPNIVNTKTSIPVKNENDELIAYATIYQYQSGDQIAVIESGIHVGRMVSEVYSDMKITWQDENELSKSIEIAEFYTSTDSKQLTHNQSTLLSQVMQKVPAISVKVSAEEQTNMADFYIESYE